MEHLHMEVVIIFMMVIKILPVLPTDKHHTNKKSYESLRLIRSATGTGSLDQTRAPSIFSCYNSTCVLNEEFCNEATKRCEKCRYEHGECTANLDCFEVCTEMKAQEICSRSEGSGETTGSPWWSYLILGIFIISVGFNIFFVIKKLHSRKRHEILKRKKSDHESLDKEETSAMLSALHRNDNIQISDQPTLPKETSADPPMDQTRVQKKQTSKGPFLQETRKH